MDINKVCISGNLTQNARLTQLKSGRHRLTFSVAVHENRKNQQTGNWETYTNYVNCTMFGKRTENLAQYLTKGTRVVVEGRLYFSEWLQDDVRKTSLTVTVNELVFLSARKNNNSNNNDFVPTQGAYPKQSSQPQRQYQQAGYEQTQQLQPQTPVQQTHTQPIQQQNQQQEQLFETPTQQPQPQYTNAQFDGIYADEIPF